MRSRGPLPRLLIGFLLAFAAVLAVAGGLSLRGPGLVAVGVAAVLAASVAAGMVRDSPRRDGRALASAGSQAAAWTVAGLLVLCGIAALFGAAVTALVIATVILGGGGVWLVRTGRPDAPPSSGAAAAGAAFASGITTAFARPPAVSPPSSGRADPAVAEAARLLPPVSRLSTDELGQEWVRTSAILAGRLEPVVRQSIVRRREETLDELERRDPAGFARWLSTGPAPGSDPAHYVTGNFAAGTDAA